MERILILDDNELDAELIKLEVEKLEEDVDIRICTSGTEYELILPEFLPDVVLSDYNLPQYNGLKALHFLQELKLNAPLIFITGFLPPTEAVKLIKEGAEDFILKDDLAPLLPAIIRALRNAEARLEARKQHELLQTISSVSKTGGWRLDKEPERLYWSDVICDIFEVPHGFTPMLDEAMAYFKEGWSRDLINQRVAETYETGKGYDEEVQIVTAKGNVRWIRTIGNLLLEDGEVIGIFGIARDITEERAQRAEQEKQHALLETISTVSGTGGWELNAERSELQWSSMTKQIFEVPQDHEPDLESAVDFFLEGEHRDRIAQCVENALNEGKPYDEELIVVTAKGNRRWVRTLGEPMYRDGRITGIYGTILDITEERRKREDQLRLARRFEKVLDATKAGTLDWNLTNNEVIIDQNVAAMGGYHIEELASLNIDGEWYTDIEGLLRFVDVDDEQALIKHIVEHGIGELDKLQIEFRIIAKDSTQELWVLGRGSIVERDDSGKPTRAVAAILNITDLKKLEQEEQAKTAQLANITKNIPGIVARHEFDADGNLQLTYLSERVKDIYGVSYDKLLADTALFGSFVHPDDREQFWNTLQNAFVKQEPYSTLFRIQVKDKVKWLQSYAAPEMGANGVIAYDSVTLDVTDLQTTKKNFESMFQWNPLPLGIVDAEKFQVLKVNREAENLYGYSEREFGKITITQ